MIRLAPGVYDDDRGGLHIDVAELLAANGYADTDQNRAMLIAAVREAFEGPITVSEEPPPS
jgi:hypothetical protein